MFWPFKKKAVNSTSREKKVFVHRPELLSILVEEEERVRRYWLEYFKNHNMRLIVFSSYVEFTGHLENISDPTQFYFDQDFDDVPGVGTQLAALVKEMPNRVSTCLVTAYPPSDFKKELGSGNLDFVLGKFPKEIFGESYFTKRLAKEIQERGQFQVLDESLKRLEKVASPSFYLRPNSYSWGQKKLGEETNS